MGDWRRSYWEFFEILSNKNKKLDNFNWNFGFSKEALSHSGKSQPVLARSARKATKVRPGPCASLILTDIHNNNKWIWRNVFGIAIYEITNDFNNLYRSALKGAIVMSPLLGITWIVGYFAILEYMIVLEILFSLFISLHGVYVLFYHLVWNLEFRAALRARRVRKFTSRVKPAIVVTDVDGRTAIQPPEILVWTSFRTKLTRILFLGVTCNR